MNAAQTLAAAEVMRRAAEGEPVDQRFPGVDWHRIQGPYTWDWKNCEFRIGEQPPHGPNAHNPDNLTPQQVETHLGWRLLDRDEIREDAPCVSGAVRIWIRERTCWGDLCYVGAESDYAYRTKLTREELAEARGIKQKVPWSKPEHVPPFCWIKTPKGNASLVIHVADKGVSIPSKTGDMLTVCNQTWAELSRDGVEYSTDRVTWHKCEVTP